MRKLLKLTVARVNETVFDGEVVSVTLPGAGGEMTLMAEHAPLVSPLKEGVMVIRFGDGMEQKFDLKSGTLEVSANHATVLI